MKFNNTKTIAIDSNVLSYFVIATTTGYTPDLDNIDPSIRKLEQEHVASFQIPMYSKWYAILPAVRDEYHKITDSDKLLFHSFADQTFVEYEEKYLDRESINKRALEFNKIHIGKKEYKDCLIAAEAEAITDTTILLSNDFDFIKRINPIVRNLIIMRPTDFKIKFDLKNESLKKSPLKPHHLYFETWWKF